MRYLEHAPAPDLRRWVDHYWELTDDRPGAAPQLVFPDGHPEWVLHTGTPFAGQGSCLWIGQMTAPVTLQAAGALRVFGIRFRPEGAWMFSRVPQGELRGQIVDLTGVVTSARSWRGDAASTDRWLRGLLCASDDRRLRVAVSLLSAGRSVDNVAGVCNWSPRQLERAMSERVGLNPKTIGALARFQRALRLREEGLGWAAVAVSAGFADQSHLIRDFRRFAGAAPTMLQTSELTDALVR